MWPLANPVPAGPARALARPELVLVARPARGAPTRRGRRIAICLAVAALLVANAVGVRHLQSVDRTSRRLEAEEQHLQQRLASRRVDIAALEQDIAATARELRLRTAVRDHLDAKATSRRAAAAVADAAVAVTLEKAGAQRARLNALNECLSILHKAMNALSVGDQGNGSTELHNLDSKCNELGR